MGCVPCVISLVTIQKIMVWRGSGAWGAGAGAKWENGTVNERQGYGVQGSSRSMGQGRIWPEVRFPSVQLRSVR